MKTPIILNGLLYDPTKKAITIGLDNKCKAKVYACYIESSRPGHLVSVWSDGVQITIDPKDNDEFFVDTKENREKLQALADKENNK